MCNENALVTFIIPAYNVEKYIGECLDSLLHQTVTDHKVIVVNDGSTDSTGEIVKKYAEAWPDRIRYVEQVNKGLGAARNTGLDLVDTEYVAFLDSDDWWDPFFVEKLKKELSCHCERPDLVFSLPWIYDAVSKRVLPWYDKGIFDTLFFPWANGNEDAISRELHVGIDRRLYELEPNACRRIYNVGFVRRLDFRFPEGVKWEDVQPHFYLLHHAKRCIGLKSTGFFYRINTGGQITAGSGASRLDIIRVYSDTMDMAVSLSFAKEEIAYIIRMMISFSAWSIDVTSMEYIDELLKKLHVLWRSIPTRYFKTYVNLCSPQRRRDKLMIAVMRSPFYWLMRDYRNLEKVRVLREFVWKVRNKLRR